MSELIPDRGAALAKAIAAAAGVTPSDCYQCGKCTAGCPMAHAMDLTPRRIVRCIQLGETDKILDSEAIWLCASCHVCAERCPNDVDLPALIEQCRYAARRLGRCAKREAEVFHGAFLENVRTFGRSQEAILEGVYNVGTGNLTQDIAQAPHMLRHGLVSPALNTVADRAAVRRLVEKAAEEDEKQ